MGEVRYSETRYGRTFLIGVGTVFGTLAFVLIALVLPASWQGGESFIKRLQWVGSYAIIGGLFAATICAVMGIPMFLLWLPIFKYLIRKGYREVWVAMATAGSLSLLASTTVFCWCLWSVPDGISTPVELKVLFLGTFVLLPVAIAVLLAWLAYRERRGSSAI